MTRLRYTDHRQPIDRWSQRLAEWIACFAIGFALMYLVIR